MSIFSLDWVIRFCYNELGSERAAAVAAAGLYHIPKPRQAFSLLLGAGFPLILDALRLALAPLVELAGVVRKALDELVAVVAVVHSVSPGWCRSVAASVFIQKTATERNIFF